MNSAFKLNWPENIGFKVEGCMTIIWIIYKQRTNPWDDQHLNNKHCSKLLLWCFHISLPVQPRSSMWKPLSVHVWPWTLIATATVGSEMMSWIEFNCLVICHYGQSNRVMDSMEDSACCLVIRNSNVALAQILSSKRRWKQPNPFVGCGMPQCRQSKCHQKLDIPHWWKSNTCH